MASSLVRVIHSLVIFVLLGVFAYDAYTNYKKLNVIAQQFDVVSVNELVPPALTFCITKESKYTFEIKVYNETVARDNYLELFLGDSFELSPLVGLVARCWILKSPTNDRALIKNPPPVPNVPDMTFTTTRSLDGPDDARAPLLVAIYDPLQRETLFDFNRFLALDPDVNRAIQFTRTKRIDISGKEFHDIKYNVIDEFRDPSLTVPGVSSTNRFTFRAASFEVEESREVRLATLPSVILETLTFLGILIGRIYFPLVGEGKYRPWGYINRFIGYYPVEHIKRKSPKNGQNGQNGQQRWTKMTNNNLSIEDGPDIKEVLEIYLEKVGKARYSN